MSMPAGKAGFVPAPTIPTPAVSFIGRKNSGKTTLLEKVIATLSDQGLRIATIKHHGHPDFDIDVPGRDSYRHRQAGARSCSILSNVRFAQVVELDEASSGPHSCEEVLSQISGYDLCLVEGFRQTSLPHVELFRAENERDVQAADGFIAQWEQDPESRPVAVVSNVEKIRHAASALGIALFGFEEIDALASFLTSQFARPKLSVVVQAGGESKRMGAPKELASFLGRPMIEQALRRVAPLADELIVVTNDPKRLGFLKDQWPKVRFAQDVLDLRGAVPGLYTAFSVARHPLVAVVACDMVDIPSRLIAEEALALRPCEKNGTGHLGALVPKTEQGIEPFAGVYRRAKCKQALDEVLERTHDPARLNIRVRKLLEAIQCGFVDCTSPQKRAHYQGSFINVNTPEELARAERAFLRDEDCVL